MIPCAYGLMLYYTALQTASRRPPQRGWTINGRGGEKWRKQKNRQKLGVLFSLHGIVAWYQGDFQKAFLYAP